MNTTRTTGTPAAEPGAPARLAPPEATGTARRPPDWRDAPRKTRAREAAKALALALGLGLGAGVATAAEPVDPLQAEVSAAETAFAQSMAERDFARFGSFVADDAVFLGGGKPQRGKAAVLAAWQRFFQGPQAPFSWRPELVAVLPSGGLAQSTGPVFAPGGQLIGHYYSTWRREPDGRWRVVLDNGYDACECGAAPPPAAPPSPPTPPSPPATPAPPPSPAPAASKPISSASPSTAMPSSRALSSLPPASSPATT